MKHITKITVLLLTVALLSVGLFSCGEPKVEPVGLQFTKSVENISYFVGDEFDKKDDFDLTQIPTVILNYSDGSFKDVSDKVTFSGYDKTKAGKQTITASYTEDEKTFTKTYEVTVKEVELVRVESSTGLGLAAFFFVGDNFAVAAPLGEHSLISVTLIGIYSNGEQKFFDESLDVLVKKGEATVDTSKCNLDGEGRFTQAGVFEVGFTYGKFSGTYNVKVDEQRP